MEQEKVTDLIEKKLNGTLSPEEEVSFEQLQSSSAEFREQIALHRSMLATIEANRKIELGEELKTLFENSETQESTSSYLRIAAVLIPFCLVVLGIYYFLYSFDDRSLFDQYYVPYELNSVRSEEHTIRTEIQQLFLEGNFEQVLQVEDAQKTSNIDELLVGLAHLELDQLDRATDVLMGIGSDSQYYYDAQWYLSLVYIKNGQTTLALPIISNLAEVGSVYRGSANDLFSDLNQ